MDYLKVPDLLVYWHMGDAPSDQLPDNGFLLGSLAGTDVHQYVLPDTALHVDGQLILYSLAHQEVVGTAGLSSKQ